MGSVGMCAIAMCGWHASALQMAMVDASMGRIVGAAHVGAAAAAGMPLAW